MKTSQTSTPAIGMMSQETAFPDHMLIWSITLMIRSIFFMVSGSKISG
jgi:hypothetical protein